MMSRDKEDMYPWKEWGEGRNRKILIVRLSSFGDIIHTIPAQQLLGSRLPRAEIHWMTEPNYAEFLRHVAGIQQVKIADTKAWRKTLSSPLEIARLIRGLKRECYDVVFDFQGLIKSAVLSRSTFSGCVAGFPTNMLREKYSHFFYNCKVEIGSGRRHQIENNLDLVDPPRFEGQNDGKVPLEIPPSVDVFLDEQLERLEFINPVLLNPGAGWPTKRWSLGRYVELAQRIKEKLNLSVLFTYGPGEEGLIQQATAIGPQIVKAFPTSILELAGLCKRACLMVAGDTGPMHLAVSMGTPVVALIGPAHPWRTGPFNPKDKVVQHDPTCPHPYRRECDNHFCMELSVDQVYQAVVERLQS
jgi:lipopolysaccharide heptosyltransferase I